MKGLFVIIALGALLLIPTSNFAFAQISDYYWSEDDGTGEIFTSDGVSVPSQITSGGFDRIDDVEIDQSTGLLWWNNWVPGTPSASEDIYNANLDGSAQTPLGLVSSCTGPPSGLTGIVLDPANGDVYYTRGVSYNNCDFGEVSVVPMSGGVGTQLDSPGGDSWHPDGIDLSAGTIFFGDPGVLFAPRHGAVNSMDTSGGSVVIDIVPHTDGLGRSIAVDAADGIAFYSAHNDFGRGFGGEINVVDLGTGVVTNLLTDPDTGIPDVEIDAANNTLCWTDYANGSIRCSNYTSSGALTGGITDVLTGLTNPYGLALAFAQEQQAVAGEIIPLDNAALMLAGIQSISLMIPIAVTAAGIGFVLIRRKI